MKTVFAKAKWSPDLQRAAFEILTDILTAAPEDFDRVFDESLARLGVGLGISRAFVRLSGDMMLKDIGREWIDPGVKAPFGARGGFGLDAMPSWRGRLAAGESLHVPDMASLADDLPEKHLFRAQCVNALLVVPVRHDAELIGVLGFAAMGSPRDFSPEEIKFAETLAAALASATRRAVLPESVERANACLKATLNAIPDMVLELDSDGRFVKYHVGRSTDYLPIAEGLKGRLPEDVFPPAGAAIAREVIAEVDATGSSQGRSFYYDMPGGRHWYQISAAAHDFGGYVMAIQDITDHRTRLHELEWLGEVARRTSNLVVVSDAESRIEWVNPAFESSTGWTLAEVRGRTPGSFLNSNQTDAATIAQIDRANAAQTAIDTEILNRSRSGKDMWLKVQKLPRFDRKGRHLGFISVETDVTELVEARSAASAAEQRAKALLEQLASAVEALKDGFVLFDAEDRLVLANTRQRALYPATAHLMVEGARFSDIFRWGSDVGEMSLNEAQKGEFLATRSAGRVFDHVVQRLEDGRVLRVRDNPTADGGRVGLCSDITELTLSQLKLRAIIEGASVGTWEWTVPTGQNEVNARWAEMIGYRLDEISTEIEAFEAMCHPEDVQKMKSDREAILSGSRAQLDYRFRLRHKDGHWIWVLSRGRVLQRDAAGRPLLMSGIHMDITELVESTQRAQAANAAKSAFLATMSHEIRTPLNGVLGMADLLTGTPLRADQRNMLDTIRESGWSLLAVLDDILDLSRLEAGKVELESKPFDLSLLLDRLDALHGAVAHTKGLVFDVVLQGEALTRVGDPTRVTQILQNLVGNAIKFTETGHVRIEVQTSHPDHVDFVITDTGIGMSDEQLSRIFEEFQQADSGIARRFGGSGLGLSIVHRLVTQMGGTVAVTSVPGEGTAVSLHLPLGAAVRKRGAVGTATDGQQAKEGAATKDLVGLKVLVAEDNATNQKILQIMLGKLGVNARFAEDGAQALTLWREQPFDLFILDISMPVVDGIETLQTMQREARKSGTPPPRAIAATANVMKEQVEEYRKVGFIDTLPKPISLAKLVDVLSRAHSAAGV